MRPWIGPRAVPVFSFVTSLALSDAIRAEGVPAAIKWPNDILVEGRKVAGSFGVVAAAGDFVDYVILGVGVNVNVERRTLERGLGVAAVARLSSSSPPQLASASATRGRTAAPARIVWGLLVRDGLITG